MGDLVSGRYPDYNEEWLFDGQPNPPYRRSISRGDVNTVTGAIGATGVGYVVAVAVQPGDIIHSISFVAGSTAGATLTHSFAAVYSGVGTSAVLLAQSADNTTASWAANAVRTYTLTTPYVVAGTPYTPQGSAPASTQNGPLIIGVMLSVTGTTIPTLHGMAGGPGTAAPVLTGQVALAQTAGSSLTATAPATLAGASASSTGFVPYVILN